MHEKDIELIESYLDNTLSPVQLKAVEARLQADSEFRKMMEIIRDLPSAVTSSSEDFRADLKKVMTENEPRHAKTHSISRRRIILGIAAALALLLMVTFLVQKKSPENLFAEHFTLPPENITVRDNQSSDAKLTNALQSYSEGDHQGAIDHFRPYLEAMPEHQAARFFYSLSLLADGQYREGRQNLLQLKGKAGSYTNSVEWYLGLIHLKTGNLGEAKASMSELAESNSSYAESARKILRSLD